MNIVWDLETDGLNASKIHVMSWSEDGGEPQSTSDYDKMREVILSAEVLIAHNQVCFDLPVIKKLLAVEPTGVVIDTLALSWYLNHHVSRHGLEAYGEKYGVPKPKVDDWENLTYEEYRHRCEEDVKINLRLWKDLRSKLRHLYKDGYSEILKYLTFKMECLRDQERYGIRLDVQKAQILKDVWSQQMEEKTEALADAMPKRILTKTVNPPKNPYKKDGTLSSFGERWKQLIKENYLPASTNTPITIKAGEERANPNSNEQVKDWLFELGWIPKTYKYVAGEKFGEERKIPQVRKDGELCPSVLDLVAIEPAIALLDGITVLQHRLGIVNGFLDTVDEDGFISAGAMGLTNTFRFKHRKPVVNLPGVDKPYGEEIRSCLLESQGDLIGCDMVSLEDTTKRHYIQPLDPDYVEEMSQPGYDPHLALALFSGAVTQEEIDQHNNGTKSLSAIRKNYKMVNYSAVYGVKETTLSRQSGMSKSDAKKLLEAYWSKNWSVSKVAERAKVREIDGQKWLFNPVSGFWHSLRAEKDRFSTLNQSTGVYVFDTFVRLVKEKGLRVIMQMHDEILVDSYDVAADTQVLDDAIVVLNNRLKLNVPIGIDYSVGKSYASVH